MSSDFYENSILPYAGIIIKICRAYTYTEEDFQDYYQEVCLQVWKSRQRFKEQSQWSTWVYRIALNVCLSLQRKAKSFSSLPEGAVEPRVDNEAFADEHLQLLYEAIRKLKEVERAILLLYLEEKSYAEIAEVTGTNANHIGVKINRIKQRLKKCSMERSIETIWKNGFNEGMLIPRLNKLYQQKSTLLVEKVKRTYRNDNAVVPLMAAALAVAGYFTGYLYTGLYLLAMLMGLFVLNRQQLSKLEGVQLTDDLYVYLTTYRNTVQGIVRFYTRLMALGLPVAALPVLYVVLDQLQPGLWAELYAKSAWSATDIMLLLALVFSGFGVAVYRMSTQALYGKQLEKLNEMISDLEELQEADQ